MLSRASILRIVACTTLLVLATILPVPIGLSRHAGAVGLGGTSAPPPSTAVGDSCTENASLCKEGSKCVNGKCELIERAPGVTVKDEAAYDAAAAAAAAKPVEFNCGGKNCAAGETCVVDECMKDPPTFRSPKRYKWEDVGLGGISIPQIINGIIARVLPLVGGLFLVMFMVGGFLYLTSNGESKKVDQAKTTLINATIGVVIVTLAYFIISVFISMTSKIVSG